MSNNSQTGVTISKMFNFKIRALQMEMEEDRVGGRRVNFPSATEFQIITVSKPVTPFQTHRPDVCVHNTQRNIDM